jgi:AraC-like DNA-binding protein
LLHDWIGAHLADDLSLAVLADQAGMSQRNFSRRDAQATGRTPARTIERLRVKAARRLLSESRAPVKRIAQQFRLARDDAAQLPAPDRRDAGGLPLPVHLLRL